MLYVYIINIFIYLGTRLVLSSVPIRLGYFGYRNIGTVWIFEGFSLVPVSCISVRFRFGSSVPVFCPCLIASINPHSILSKALAISSFRVMNLFQDLVCRECINS